MQPAGLQHSSGVAAAVRFLLLIQLHTAHSLPRCSHLQYHQRISATPSRTLLQPPHNSPLLLLVIRAVGKLSTQLQHTLFSRLLNSRWMLTPFISCMDVASCRCRCAHARAVKISPLAAPVSPRFAQATLSPTEQLLSDTTRLVVYLLMRTDGSHAATHSDGFEQLGPGCLAPGALGLSLSST